MDRAISLGARRIDLSLEPAFYVGSAKVDPAAHEIQWAGHAQRIQPQPLKVFVALHDRIGEAVSRDELIERCWDGRFVGDDVINRCISVLRRVFAVTGEMEIQTVPRGGYRLVETANAPLSPEKRRRWILGAGAAFAVVAVAAVGLLRAREQPSAFSALVDVQPLSAATGDASAQALSAGLGSAILHNLTGSETPIEIEDANSRAAPSLVLRGKTVSDRGELRASVELLSGRSGEIIWASNFDGTVDQLTALRDHLSLHVARLLHCAYGNGSGTQFDADAAFARLVLAHCDSLGERMGEAQRFDSQVTERWPDYARGWSEYAIDTALQSRGLPDGARSAAFRRAISYARRALTLDPHQGLAYTAIGTAIHDAAPWAAEERLAERALAADPKSPEVHNWHSGLLAEIGRLQDGLNEAQRSYQLDHFLPGKIDQLIWINVAAGNLDDAQDELTLARRNWPDNPWWDHDAVMLGEAGRSPADALNLIASNKVRVSATEQRQLIAFLRWRLAPSEASRRAAIEAIKSAARVQMPTDEQVQLLAALGDEDGGYALAGRMQDSRGSLGWFSPDLASFRGDARFMPLAARLGLAQTWTTTGHWPDFCTEANQLRACQVAAAAALRRDTGRVSAAR